MLKKVNVDKSRPVILAAIIVVVFGVCAISAYGNAFSEKGTGYYQYPSVSGYSAVGGQELCRIPEETLKKMSDEELAQAVVDYPYLVDVFALEGSNTISDYFAGISDAYSELLSRENGMQVLSEKAEQLYDEGEEAWADALTILIEQAEL